MMHFPLFLGTLFCMGVLSTVAGGGLGAVLLSITALLFSPVEAVAITALLGVVVQLSKSVAFRRDILWKLVALFSVTSIPMSAVGAALFLLLPLHLMGVLIGLTCIGSVLHMRLFPQKPLEGTTGLLLLIGAVSGFLVGFLGQGPGMRLAVLRRMGLSPKQLVATASATALFANLGRLPVYVSRLHWTQDLVIVLAASVPTLLLAVACGRALHDRVHARYLEYVIDVVLVVGGITMIVRSL